MPPLTLKHDFKFQFSSTTAALLIKAHYCFNPWGLKRPPTTSIKPQYLQLVRHPSLVQHMRVEDIAEGFDLTSSFGQLAPDQKVTVTTDGQYHHVRCAGALLHHAKSQCDYN